MLLEVALKMSFNVIDEYTLWKLTKAKPELKAGRKQEKILKLKWKQHEQRRREEALRKFAGRKHNEFKQKRAEAMKKRARA